MTLVAFLASGLALLAQSGGIQVNSSVKSGDVLSGVVELRVTVQSPSPVTQVEFYIDGKLRATDTSTPYTYLLDTIVEKEGAMQIEIGVYTASGDSRKVVLNVTIDNGVSKGIEFHLQNATQFLQVSKWDEAIQAARIALKADENNNKAKILMARAYLGKNMLDRAQQWAEDAILSEETVEGAELLAAIHVQRAFRIISTSGDKGDALKAITDALKAAVQQKRLSLQLRIKALGPVTDANRLQHADLLIANHEYSAARRILSEKWNEYEPDTAIGNRLIYAMMRSGMMTEAYAMTEIILKRGVPDAATYALRSAGFAYYRKWQEAQDALREGTFSDPNSPTLMTAAAYLATMRGERNAMLSQVNQMLEQHVNAGQAYYYLFTLQYMVGDYDRSRDNFREALILEPLLLDAYVERGYQALLNARNLPSGLTSDKDLVLDQAKAFFEVALAVRPDSAEALNGLALVSLHKGDTSEAVRMSEAAKNAAPQQPWAWFTYAAALGAARRPAEATQAVDKAGALDQVVLKGRSVPSVDQAWDYTWRYARQPVLIPPKS
jgi:tetratricopeptide (TPR) repeat protein